MGWPASGLQSASGKFLTSFPRSPVRPLAWTSGPPISHSQARPRDLLFAVPSSRSAYAGESVDASHLTATAVACGGRAIPHLREGRATRCCCFRPAGIARC